MRVKGIKIHRVTSWLLVLIAIITIILGYGASRRWFTPPSFYLLLHLIFDWIIVALSIIHVFFSRKYVKLKLRRMLKGLTSYRAGPTNFLRLLQRITKWIMIILTFFIGVSGLIYYWWFAVIFENVFIFSWHLDLDLALLITVIFHIGIGSKFFFTRNKINHWGVNLFIGSLILTSTIAVIYINYPPDLLPFQIRIGNDYYSFDPDDIDTVRPDIFQNGTFSAFDTLVYLNSTGAINLTYHFDASMNTHVIDSLNGEINWWHMVYYSGGHKEKNAVRMDHYPWKNETRIIVYREKLSFINHVYDTFREEVTRLNNNNGTVVIPTVTINGNSFNLEFYNVSVSPHNFRNDTLQIGVITALDVIMTLGDLGEFTYEILFYASMGQGTYVRNYFVYRINGDRNAGRCGFVYEVGDNDFKYPGPNYVFLASDHRILTSPEYLRFFWTCL
ncbi:MAG: cytochrome b/b6 domain-containing protein [Promethearchaeota archaeon]|jgi:hypothetical protein